MYVHVHTVRNVKKGEEVDSSCNWTVNNFVKLDLGKMRIRRKEREWNNFIHIATSVVILQLQRTSAA